MAQQKTLKLILSSIGLVIIIITALSIINNLKSLNNLKFSQKKDKNQDLAIDTSKWKTYRNEIIGIEFKYPNTWPTLKPDDRGDIMRNGKIYTGFTLDLPDLSHLDHTFFNYDNLPIEKQYNQIKCRKNDPFIIECENRISSNGVKYIWKVTQTPIGGITYYALIPTGKYILILNFQDKDNYEKRADEYQKILTTLKIPK